MKKISKTIMMLCMIIVFTVGCSDVNQSGTKEQPINTEEASDNTADMDTASEESSFSITDMEGKEVTFDQVPHKMVVLLASDVEILYELGAQDQIVAVGEYCNYPEEALQKEIVTTGDDLNIEQIVATEPNVVIMGEMGQTTDQIMQLENAGIKVVVTNSQSIADTYTAIELLGKISGKEEEAANLIVNMKNSFMEIEQKSTGNYEKTIYFEASPLEYGLWTTGTGTFMQELADIVKVKNIFSDSSGWVEISEEQVLDRNPDYIVTSTMGYQNGLSPVDEILNRKNWQGISAVKNKKIFNGDSDMMTRPGPRLVDAAEQLYEFIYGE